MAGQVHRYTIGDIDVTVLSDGFRMVPLDGYIAQRQHQRDRRRRLQAAGLPTDQMHNTYSPIVLTTGGKRVLFDTGNGEAASRRATASAARSTANLAAAGIDRDTIDVVVISHFHADHVNGLLMADDSRRFPTPRSWCRRSNGRSGWTTAR